LVKISIFAKKILKFRLFLGTTATLDWWPSNVHWIVAAIAGGVLVLSVLVSILSVLVFI